MCHGPIEKPIHDKRKTFAEMHRLNNRLQNVGYITFEQSKELSEFLTRLEKEDEK